MQVPGCFELLAASVNAACERHEVQLFAYVFMPEHVHLLVYPCREETRIQDFLYAVKRPMSFRAKRLLLTTEPELCRTTLMVEERPGKVCYRFWMEGPGYDRNIFGRDPVERVIDYIHANPVRRGLCEYTDGWMWSSWHAYHTPDVPQGIPKVHIDWTP